MAAGGEEVIFLWGTAADWWVAHLLVDGPTSHVDTLTGPKGYKKNKIGTWEGEMLEASGEVGGEITG